MKTRELVFNKLPNIGSLYLEEVLFKYELYDMLFVCVDDKGNRYFCMCTDIIEMYSWIICKIDKEKLLDIINNKLKILEVFAESKEKVITADWKFKESDEIEYKHVYYKDISTDNLPMESFYLGEKENLKDYIAVLECSR